MVNEAFVAASGVGNQVAETRYCPGTRPVNVQVAVFGQREHRDAMARTTAGRFQRVAEAIEFAEKMRVDDDEVRWERADHLDDFVGVIEQRQFVARQFQFLIDLAGERTAVGQVVDLAREPAARGSRR